MLKITFIILLTVGIFQVKADEQAKVNNAVTQSNVKVVAEAPTVSLGQLYSKLQGETITLDGKNGMLTSSDVVNMNVNDLIAQRDTESTAAAIQLIKSQ